VLRLQSCFYQSSWNHFVLVILSFLCDKWLLLWYVYTHIHIYCLENLLLMSESITFFPCYFSIGQHLNILVLADLLAVLLMRILQLVEQMVQHVDSLQIPDWQRGESGRNDIEIIWAGHIYILLQTYQKAMVWQLAEEEWSVIYWFQLAKKVRKSTFKKVTVSRNRVLPSKHEALGSNCSTTQGKEKYLTWGFYMKRKINVKPPNFEKSLSWSEDFT
jgi:hypothetical protein